MTGKCNKCGFIYDEEADPRDSNALLLARDGFEFKRICPTCNTDDYLMDDAARPLLGEI